MRLLLDTNVLTWIHQKPNRIGKATQSKLSTAHTIYFSPLSVFEWSQKDDDLQVNTKKLVEATRSLDFLELPLTVEAVMEANRFGSLRQSDPLDLLLLAQAASERMEFLTSDMRILSLGFDFVSDSTL